MIRRAADVCSECTVPKRETVKVVFVHMKQILQDYNQEQHRADDLQYLLACAHPSYTAYDL